MSYKTGRGNVAKKGLRFHATVKMVSDFQLVTAYPVAASRLWALTYAFWQGFECARGDLRLSGWFVGKL